MSAFGGKADGDQRPPEPPLLAISGPKDEGRVFLGLAPAPDFRRVYPVHANRGPGRETGPGFGVSREGVAVMAQENPGHRSIAPVAGGSFYREAAADGRAPAR